jgi:hypothetical protein
VESVTVLPYTVLTTPPAAVYHSIPICTDSGVAAAKNHPPV